MPKKFDNSNRDEGFKSPLTTNSAGKHETWPQIANVPKASIRDPLGVVPRIQKSIGGKDKD
jgi:hypothetical protein